MVFIREVTAGDSIIDLDHLLSSVFVPSQLLYSQTEVFQHCNHPKRQKPNDTVCGFSLRFPSRCCKLCCFLLAAASSV